MTDHLDAAILLVMRRRKFLLTGLLATVGFSLIRRVTRGQPNKGAAELKNDSSFEPAIAALEKQITALMAETTVPGLSIAVIQNAKLVWRRGFGLKDTASRKPVDGSTVFEAQSMTKPVFAYAVMKLCEKGVIDLDTPLTQYYAPARFREGDSRLRLITVRHVLSHTSGLQNWQSDEEPLKLHSTPGEKYRYSGEGYSYLQSVVAHVTGEPIETFLQANVLAPFGMPSSGFVWNDAFQKHAARPHDKSGAPIERAKGTTASIAKYGAAGGLYSTPTDYANFLIEAIGPKANDRFRLNRKSLEEMIRPHVKVPDDPFSSSWGLGWQIQQTDKGDVIGHGGSFNGFHCYAAASVARKSGYVIMTNGDNGTNVLMKIVFGEPLQQLFAP